MEEMNLFKAFVENVPVKTPLSFGHNDGIVIESADFSTRKRNGIDIKANSFIRLSKIDSETKKVVASTEISYFNLDPTKDFVGSNFTTQFNNFAGIIEAVGGSVEDFADKFNTIFSDFSDDSMARDLKKPDIAKQAQETLMKGLEEVLDGKTGVTSKLLKCKLISNKGGFMNPGDEFNWILPSDATEELPPVTSREQSVYKKALTADKKKVKPDSTGKSPDSSGSGEAKVTASTDLDAI